MLVVDTEGGATQKGVDLSTAVIASCHTALGVPCGQSQSDGQILVLGDINITKAEYKYKRFENGDRYLDLVTMDGIVEELFFLHLSNKIVASVSSFRIRTT
jgi:hypothetical protein